jgi:LPS-assembly lipoprotein
MQRRSFSLHLAASALAVPLVSACGFKLRGGESFSFKSLFVATPQPAGPIATLLFRRLESGGQLQLIIDPAKLASAEVALYLLSEQREKVVVGVGVAGQVREFQLRARLRFRIATPQGADLVAETEIFQQRDISYSESAALAKEAEEARLYQDMQTDIVQQFMRRLSALKV